MNLRATRHGSTLKVGGRAVAEGSTQLGTSFRPVGIEGGSVARLDGCYINSMVGDILICNICKASCAQRRVQITRPSIAYEFW